MIFNNIEKYFVYEKFLQHFSSILSNYIKPLHKHCLKERNVKFNMLCNVEGIQVGRDVVSYNVGAIMYIVAVINIPAIM